MEINKETFTIQDLKQLLKEAFEFDYEKHKGEAKFYPFTIIEWHKSDIFKNKLSLDNVKGNIKEWRRPFDAGGTYFRAQKSLAVFFKRSEMLSFLDYTELSLEELIIFYVIATFHELGHHYHDEFRYNITKWEEINLNAFSYDIDYFVFGNNPHHYEEHHDEYWIEIDANLYSVERAYDFLKSKGLITKKIEKKLQEYKNEYLFDSNNYDIHYFLCELHKIVKENDEIDIADYTYFYLFYENNQTFRAIDDILCDFDELGIGEEILNYFFSSKDFLDSLDFNSLSSENDEIIMNAIEYVLEVEINRRKKNREFLQNKQITAKQYLDADTKICSKIAYFNKKIEQIKKAMELSNINETKDKLKK